MFLRFTTFVLTNSCQSPIFLFPLVLSAELLQEKCILTIPCRLLAVVEFEKNLEMKLNAASEWTNEVFLSRSQNCILVSEKRLVELKRNLERVTFLSKVSR